MKIAAFNVRNLGQSKVDNVNKRRILIKIVSRYSVVVMLEVLDQDGSAMKKFLTELNKFNRNTQYAMVCSKPLGRTSYREKFVFFYRKDEVRVMNSYQYREQEEEDVLAREPFAVQFACPSTSVKKLVLIPVHTKPQDAEIELDALDDVVEAVRDKWRNDNIMILGDFNADGRYLSKKKKSKIRIYSPPYYWLIDDDVDTTTSDDNDHTYDRIVVFGDEMYEAVVPNSAKPFDFQRAYRLTARTTEGISDHYPVEVELEEE
ncbi:deoxyribonuclease-1-like [Symphorus nematophorus]